MIYDFEDRRCNITGFDFPIGKAPKIGASIKRNGKTWRRVPSRTTAPQVMRYECVDYGLPRRDFEIRAADGRVLMPGVDPKTGKDSHPITSKYKRVDSMGRPVFESKHALRSTYDRDEVKKADIVYGR